MKPKHKALMEVLAGAAGPLTAAQLAKRLGVSVRSVKSYIKEINEGAREKPIQATQAGYELTGSLVAPEAEEDDLPQTYLERAYYIIKRGLIDQDELDLYELSDELYISYSTLKATIAKMNRTFENAGVHFAVKGDALYIEGTEKNLRRLVSYVIFEETNQNFLDLRNLENHFPEARIMVILIKETFQGQDYYLNDFSYMNLVMHCLILINRSGGGQSLADQHGATAGEDELAGGLCTAMEGAFDLELSPGDRAEIADLIRVNVNLGAQSAAAGLEGVVDDETIDVARAVVTALADTYAIDLDNDTFLPPFALHLRGLRARLLRGTENKNPMLATIRGECRTIYDIAVTAALILKGRWGMALGENEIAFIALHIGAELLRQQKNTQKIKTLLICPGYQGIETQVYNQLMMDFGADIEIITADEDTDADEIGAELIITTIALSPEKYPNAILVSPLTIHEMRHRIEGAIAAAKDQAKRAFLRRRFDDFFSSDLFFRDPDWPDREALIGGLTGRMEDLGYVEGDYAAGVREREEASATAFGPLAMPHSIQMNAVKTVIAVVISKEGVSWNEDQRVHFVFMTAINRVDRSHFTDIFDALVALLDNPATFDALGKAKDFQDFRRIIRGAV